MIATGMQRGECCGLKWADIDYQNHTIHIQSNVVKITGEEIFTKPPKTSAGDHYAYFSPEMESLLIANGADVATVAGLLGHAQPSTTLDIYIHAFDKDRKVASEMLQQGLEI